MKVLVTPLDWGLGHATRCVPLIRELIRQGHEVEVASSAGALRLLQLEFPLLEFFELPSYQPEYSVSSNLLPKLIRQSTKFLSAIRQEHRLIEEIAKSRAIQTIISDHRYGCHSGNTKNIFVTHQVNFQFQGFWAVGGGLFNSWHHRNMLPFQEIWIPDLPGSLLSGNLSRSHLPNCKYVGLLSRFHEPSLRQLQFDLLVLISGPEPQRSVFERIMKLEVSKTNFKALIVKGQVGLKQNILSQHQIAEVDHLPGDQLQQAIEQSKFIVCRSGYSSLMDLARLKRKNVLLVPTPGQPEQVYLAKMLKDQGLVHSVSQNEISLEMDLSSANQYKGFVEMVEQDLLHTAVASIDS
jgi:predicted glycosyltransferase